MGPAGFARAFLAALDGAALPRFSSDGALGETLARHHAAASAAFPDIVVDDLRFVTELARRLGSTASPEIVAQLRPGHLHLAIACGDGDPGAIRRFEAEFFPEVAASARRLRATADQADELRSYVRRILFVAEPPRQAAVREFSGRGDLRGYVRVTATRRLLRVLNRERREVHIDDEAVHELLSPTSDPAFGYLRERYRDEVNAALVAALAALPEEARALLRYSLVHGWTVDRIGTLYGIHRATAARRVAAARIALGETMRTALAERLAISIDEVDSIVRLVQSRVEVSMERLLRSPTMLDHAVAP